MNNSFISFDKKITKYTNRIFIIFTNTIIESLQNNGYDYHSFTKILSGLSKFIFVPGYSNEKTNFDIYLNNSDIKGIIKCSINNEGKIIARDYKKVDFDAQNNAIKKGFVVEATNKITIIIRYKVDNYFKAICNNYEYDINKFSDEMSSDEFPKKIAELISEERKKQDSLSEEAEQEEEYNKNLLDYLDLAENYSNLIVDLEKRRMMESASVYVSIHMSDYKRVDRVAYRFKVISDDFNEELYSVGAIVEFGLKGGSVAKGEIVNLIKDEDEEFVTDIEVLFKEQVDLNRFESSGRFSLSVNETGKRVQTKAIDNIRNKNAPAKYMNEVLGKNNPGGFDDTDTSAIELYENSKEYPPNSSQMDAIKKGIKTKDIYLVMGPPGTGKTTVILAWIKHFIGEDKRVLVSSKNNKAVDNVLERISDKDTEIIRVGSEAKIQEQVKEYMYENRMNELRHNISDKTQKSTLYLDEITEKWKEYYNVLQNYIYYANLLETEELNFKREMHNIGFVEAYNSVVNLLYLISNNQIQRSQMTNLLHNYVFQVEKYEENRNIFYRFFNKNSYNSNINNIRQTTFKYRQLYEYGMNLVASYREKYNIFYEKYCELYNYFILKMYNLIKTRDYYLWSINIKPERDIRNKWLLFDEAYSMPFDSDKNIELLSNYINDEFNRANYIKNVVMEWKTYVEDNQNYALGSILLESVQVVGATCIGINTNVNFKDVKFDVAIIDEAGQIQIQDALVPMSISPKTIMLGDHKQIPPSVEQELIDLCEANNIDSELLEKSLFEELYNKLPASNKTILDTQYRMPGEIADTISDWFYDKQYKSPDFKRNLKGKMPFSISPYIIIDTSDEINRFEHKIKNAGCDNDLEAEIVKDIINLLSKDEDTDFDEIGVISAYKAQVKLIKKKLRKLNNEIITPYIKELVNSLDSYQGQERDIIIYSFTKSSSISVNRRRIGFLCELRRLNVALTRAKKTLVLIGDMSFLSECAHIDTDADGNEIYEKSEREFGDFIKKLIEDVSKHGEIISYNIFKERMLGV